MLAPAVSGRVLFDVVADRMKCIEEVQIPLFVLAPPETCRLVEWHVRDGEHMMMGQVIFDFGVGDEVYAVESFFTGFIKIESLAGSVHAVGIR